MIRLREKTGAKKSRETVPSMYCMCLNFFRFQGVLLTLYLVFGIPIPSTILITYCSLAGRLLWRFPGNFSLQHVFKVWHIAQILNISFFLKKK